LTLHALRISPILSAAILASSGSSISGFVAISTKGIPNLSTLKVFSLLSCFIILAASSSRHIVAIPIFF